MLKRLLVVAVGLAVSGLSGTSTRAQSVPQQWTIITTAESAPNAVPLLDDNGDPYSCSGQDADNVNDANPNCYNPLVATTDWTINSGLGAIVGASVGTSTNTAYTATNSNCSASSGTPTATSLSENAVGDMQQVTFVLTLDGGATITYQGQLAQGSTQFTGTFSSTGACMNGDTGTFTATLFPQVNATYAGQFETSSGGQGVSVTLATDSNFNLTGTVTPDANAHTCFSNMTIATPLANSYSNSFASGDVLFAVASDDQDNVVVFVASNTDANGDVLTDEALFFTYYGVSGACSGVYEVDAPFEKVQKKAPRHPPLRFRRRPVLRDFPILSAPRRRKAVRQSVVNFR